MISFDLDFQKQTVYNMNEMSSFMMMMKLYDSIWELNLHILIDIH